MLGGAGIPDDYLSSVGRSKDLIISGGYNVYPKEIEMVIDAMPGVQESAVIGVPHADFGEAVVAVVVPRAGTAVDPAAIQAGLKSGLANFKVPKNTRDRFAAAQCHGQGPEERAAAAVRGPGMRRGVR